MKQFSMRLNKQRSVELTQVGFGFYFAASTEDGSAVVVARFANFQYGAFVISAGDLIALHTAQVMPRLDSAVLLHAARTRRECIEPLIERLKL